MFASQFRFPETAVNGLITAPPLESAARDR